MSELPYLVGAGMFLAVMFITYGFMQSQGHFRQNRLVMRLKTSDSAEVAAQHAAAAAEMTPWQKMSAPAVEIIKQRLGTRFSQGGLELTEKMLVAANRPYGLAAADFQALKILGAVALGSFGFLYSALLGEWGFGQLPFTVLGLLAGYVVPDFVVKRILRKRRETITREIIGVLDLLSLAVEHGVEVQVALKTISEKGYGILAEEIGIVLRDIDRGMTLTDAFRDMSYRCDTPEVHELYNNVIRLSSQYGTPMKDILGGIAAKVRHQVYQKANEMAENAKVRIYMPIGVLNVPAMFLILLGPALLMMYRLF